MTKPHVAACGHSDEDQTAKIKEKVVPVSWDCGPLITHYEALSELFNLLKRNRRSGFQGIYSCISQCNLLQKYNSWLIMKLSIFWRKILSSSWFSCVLDSIPNGLRQVNHEHCEKTFGNHPLNVKSVPKKESEKLKAIKEIWGSIFTSIGLVLWILRNPQFLGSLD